MKKEGSPVIKKVAFNSKLLNQPEIMPYAEEFWPVVYVLCNNNIQQAYIGETTDIAARMNAHLNNALKSKLSEVHIITSDRFNKSASLDVESNLIKYVSGDGQYKLLNANIGLTNHNYYQKQWYRELFRDIWNKLRSEGLVKHSLEYIDNSDLFKYSPYKSLARDQRKAIIILLKSILNPDSDMVLLEGGAGTGKTILAIFLFKLLHTRIEEFNFTEFGEDEEVILKLTKAVKEIYPNPRMALIIPMSSFRKTIQKVFKNIKGLKPGMVAGPSALANKKFDIVVVDEAHRLRRRVVLGNYFKTFDSVSASLGLDKERHTELDWVRKQSDKAILFYDKNQSIKPSDVPEEDFTSLKKRSGTIVQPLTSQLRVRGGRDYIDYISRLLNCRLRKNEPVFTSGRYRFLLFDSIEDMISEIKVKNEQVGLSRLIAGYAWPWISKKDRTKYDIHIEDIHLQWNSTKEDWVNSFNAINEVGCIHTTQGYDLNYSGVIFGKEISYDENKDEIVIIRENYLDKNGKMSIKNSTQLKDYIIHIYETLMLRAIHGTYVYVCDEKLKKYFSRHMERFVQPVEADSGYIGYASDTTVQRIPLYDLKAAAGTFGNAHTVENYIEIPLPQGYPSPQDLFACTVIGDSMNKIIPNGSVCLFKKYTGGSRDGRIVLVESGDIQDMDSGSSYTVKEYHSEKITTEEGWVHQSITLKPLTYTEGYKDIHLQGTALERLHVIGVFEKVL
jgi:DUF2075 family protein